MDNVKVIRYKKHSPTCPCNNGEREFLYLNSVKKHVGANGRGHGYCNFALLRCNWDAGCPGEVLVSLDDICEVVAVKP